MSDVQTPAEAQAEKQEAAHKNQVKAEKEYAAKLPENSDAAQGEVAAPGNAKAGTTYPKEGRTTDEVGTVEYYQAGTAGDNADPDRVFESRDPRTRPNVVDEDDRQAAEEAADKSRIKVDPSGSAAKAAAQVDSKASGDGNGDGNDQGEGDGDVAPEDNPDAKLTDLVARAKEVGVPADEADAFRKKDDAREAIKAKLADQE